MKLEMPAHHSVVGPVLRTQFVLYIIRVNC